jgi:RsiW-degrading membrane proteinase PrsW (M82 family)
MWWVDTHDAKRPEPRHLLRLVAVGGGLATIPCIFAQLGLQKIYGMEGVNGALFTAYVTAALTEESAKAAVLWLLVWRHPSFDERFDGIVYATRAGLGFALVENVGYLVGTESAGGYLGVYLLRAVLAVPGHAIFAGFIGHFAARKRFDNEGPGLVGGLIVAIFLHGTYDAALFLVATLPPNLALLGVFLLPIPFIVVIAGYRKLRALGAEDIARDDLAHHRVPTTRLPFGVGFILR